MYRFDSIEEFEKAVDSAYADGLERGVFGDFDGVALFCLRSSVAQYCGELRGLIDAIPSAEDVPEFIQLKIKELTEFIEIYAEAMTLKMEELGLL